MSHTTDLPVYFPPEITPGETLEWEKDFDDFPADEGWVVTYYVRGPGTGFDIAGTADGKTHLFTVPATTSDDITVAGVYSFQAWAVKASEKHLADSGTTKALPSLAAISSPATTFDGRSNAKKILDAIDAIMAGKASIDQQEYTIGNAGSQRMLKRIDPLQLLELRKYYAAIVRNEKSRGQTNQIVYVQFD